MNENYPDYFPKPRNILGLASVWLLLAVIVGIAVATFVIGGH